MLLRRRGIWMLALIFLSAGCGLSEYEKRMDRQNVALKRFDEENKALEDPLDAPMFVDPKAPIGQAVLPVEFYLRPPKGTVIKAKDLEEPKPGKFVLVHYPGPAGFNVLVTTGKTPADEKNPKPKEMTPKEFQHRVRQALAGFYQMEYKKPFDFSKFEKTEKKTIPSVSAKGAPINLNFDYQAITDDPDPGRKNIAKDPKDKSADPYHDFRLYFYQTAGEQAAIIYEMPAAKRNDGEANLKVDFSIRSLALGADAMIKRHNYRKHKR